MTNDWFNEYMFRLVVNNEYVPAELLKEYEQKPLMVMPEDHSLWRGHVTRHIVTQRIVHDAF